MPASSSPSLPADTQPAGGVGTARAQWNTLAMATQQPSLPPHGPGRTGLPTSDHTPPGKCPGKLCVLQTLVTRAPSLPRG